MSKPDDISQEAWDIASDIFNGKYAAPGGLYSENYVAPMARAIMAAKAEEREACAKEADKGCWRAETTGHGQARAVWVGPHGPQIADAIRSRT